MNKLTEQWQPIKGYEGRYEVSDHGNVKSLCHSSSGRLRKSFLGLGGYNAVQIYRNGVPKGFYIHRLVAQAFLPNPEGKPQVNHKNGVKTDNRIENIEWCTNSENRQHAYDVGLQAKRPGEINGNASLSSYQVKRLRLLHECSPRLTLNDLARAFSVDRSTIHLILKRKTWQNI